MCYFIDIFVYLSIIMDIERNLEQGPGATIVSAFITNINYRADRNYDKYFALAKQLLLVPMNKVIFMDKTILGYFKDYINEHTTIIPFDKYANYLYEHKDQLDNFELNTQNPSKDTIEYMFTMAYKTEFVKKAIEMNNYNAKQFIWMDIGIKHMMDHLSQEEFSEKVLRLKYLEHPNNVRIPSIWNPDHQFQIDIYKDICWCFAGSLFGGNPKSLLEFADLTKDECLRIIQEKKSLMWEINVWKLVYNMDRWRFLYYTCTHDTTILDSY